MKASLDKVVKIAEIIGSLGIVISLIFVSIQYQNNSLALQTSTANSVNANIADWYTAFFENAEASEAFMKFVSAPESVTPSERFRAIMRLHSLNLHLQNALYLEGKGVLDENLRKTISMAVYSGLGSPGFYVFWEQRKDMYTEFIEWYTELYGGKVPKGKDLYDFMEAKLGKVQRGRFKGYRLIHSFEQDLDITPNDI